MMYILIFLQKNHFFDDRVFFGGGDMSFIPPSSPMGTREYGLCSDKKYLAAKIRIHGFNSVNPDFKKERKKSIR